MPSSYNGWSAGPGWSVKGGQLEPLVIDGEPFSPGVRAGDVHDVLAYVADQLDKRVEPVDKGHSADDWGYNYRPNVNNPSVLSCHASGTAIDYNATRHPNGKRNTWTVEQRAEIVRILREVDNVVRNLPSDEMHFEIVGNAAAVARVAARLRGGPVPAPQPSQPQPITQSLQKGSRGPKVGELQRKLRTGYPAYRHESPVKRGVLLGVDDDFGDWTDAWVRLFQRKSGLKVDGIVGPATAGRLGFSL